MGASQRKSQLRTLKESQGAGKEASTCGDEEAEGEKKLLQKGNRNGLLYGMILRVQLR